MEKNKAGVFSPCDNLDTPSMIKYLQVLHSNYPSIKINSVRAVKKHRGFKFFFSEPEASIVLQKNQLSSGEQTISIYPLTAYLIILDVDEKKTPLSVKKLRIAMERKFGKVLKVVKTNNSNKNKDWRIELDIPEFIGLRVFERSHITLRIPGGNKVTLQLCCKQCELIGHFQHQCTARLEDESQRGPEVRNEIEECDEQLRENYTEPDVSLPYRSSEGTPESCNTSLEASVSCAERTDVEKFMSVLKKTALQGDYEITMASNNYTAIKPSTHASNSSAVEKYIGKEGSAFQDNNEITKAPDNSTANRPSSHATNSSVVEKYIKKENSAFSDDNKITKAPDNSTANKLTSYATNFSSVKKHTEKEVSAFQDNIEITKAPDNSAANRSSSSHATSSTAVKKYIEKEVLSLPDINEKTKASDNSTANSSNATNSSVGVESRNVEQQSTSFLETGSADYSPSGFPGHSCESSTDSKTRRGVDMSNLSETLEGCINQACVTVEALDRESFDLFLLHVSNKHYPKKFALNYTNDTELLKKQLQSILDNYYKTTPINTQKDKDFINWLIRLIERYDGPVRKKRKRGAETDFESPTETENAKRSCIKPS